MTQRNPVIPSELMITTTPTSKKDTSRLYIINNIIKLFINNTINNTINNIINNITPPRNLSESYHRIKHLTTPDLTFIPPIFPSPYLMVGYGGLSYVYSKFYLWVDEPRKNIYNQS